MGRLKDFLYAFHSEEVSSGSERKAAEHIMHNASDKEYTLCAVL